MASTTVIAERPQNHEHLLNYDHSSIICKSHNLEAIRCPSGEEWVRKMWYIYTMEYYSAVKYDILKFAVTWMALEKKKHPSWGNQGPERQT